MPEVITAKDLDRESWNRTIKEKIKEIEQSDLPEEQKGHIIGQLASMLITEDGKFILEKLLEALIDE